MVITLGNQTSVNYQLDNRYAILKVQQLSVGIYNAAYINNSSFLCLFFVSCLRVYLLHLSYRQKCYQLMLIICKSDIKVFVR